MNRDELALLLTELDEALAQAFPGPEPVRVLVVGGACLLLAGVTERPTRDIDVIITDLFGTGIAPCRKSRPGRMGRESFLP